MLRQLDRLARSFIPFFLTMISILIGFAAAPSFYQIIASFSIISVYHWSIYRPHLLPAIAVFFLGLLYDLLGNTPFGNTAFIFVLIQWIVSSQRRPLLGQTFLMIWWGFFIVSLGSVFIEWSIISLIHMTFVSPIPAILKAVIEIALFPLIVHFILLPLTRLTTVRE